MLGIGMLVNVLWQWYLPGGSLEKNPLLNEVYAYFMGKKSTRNGIYTCGQKDKQQSKTQYIGNKRPSNKNPI